MPDTRIAVIGAGPKAAAIAAKAETLNRIQKTRLAVSIFEKHVVGANWTGKHGYTDGVARLCTPAERDLGFPYDAGVFDPKIASAMYGEYSWGAFLLERGRADARLGFSDWINRGRKPPTHAEFAEYIAWATKKSSAKVYFGEVIRLEKTTGGWLVHRRTPTGGNRSEGPFAGVVFSGPGEPANRVTRIGTSDCITDGRLFWDDPEGFLQRGSGSEEPIVILGAGGTAAAIAARTVRVPFPREVVVIGDQAALFTRAEAFFESQIFTDDNLWERLPIDTRREFTGRLNRGVVWAAISEELSHSRNIRFEPGRGKEILVRSGVAGEEIVVTFTRGKKDHTTYASLAIDASGFDGWWFASLLPADLRDPISDPNIDSQDKLRRAAANGMSRYFEVFGPADFPIQAPMISQSVGPGFASLMVLGAMSDRVLDRYLPSFRP